MRILVFGDSIAWGAFDTEKGGWVDRLKQYIMKPGVFNEVFNFGNPGSTTERLLEFFEAVCSTIIKIKKKKNVIITAIGINDSQYIIPNSCVSVQPKEFENNIEQLIKIAKRHATYIVFIGPHSVIESKVNPWLGKGLYENKRIKQYNNFIKSICKKHNVHFIPLFDKLTLAMLPDGLHPNPKGHQRIFEIVRDYLEKNQLV